MKIIQLAVTLNRGDAIGNHIVLSDQLFRKMGLNARIYAINVQEGFAQRTVKRYQFIQDLKKEDLLIFHMSIGTELADEIPKYNCKKILVYHNITPPDLLGDYDTSLAYGCHWGYRQMARMQDWYDGIIAMSPYDKSDLVQMGYPKNRIWVMPSYLIPFEDYRKKPSARIMEAYGRQKNILFVGRWAANKKQEDLIQAFTYYQRKVDRHVRLILVGKGEDQAYGAAVQAYIQKLGTKNVIMPGHISFAELIAFYKIADVFLCMSEHEGFCVPLVEAMYFRVPVLAYAAAAVPDTLGTSGVLVSQKDPVFIAKLLERLLHDQKLRNEIVEQQEKRLECFSQKKAEQALEDYLNQWLI